MSTRGILVKNTFWLGMVEAISKVIMFGVTVMLVRYLGPSQFGVFNLAFAYVSMFMILSDFGLGTVATREISKHKDLTEKYLSNLIGIKLSLSAIISVLIVISMFVVPTTVAKTMILTVLFYNLVQNLGNVFVNVFSAWEKMELVFVSRISYYLGILISAMTVIYFKGSVVEVVLAYSLTTLISTLISLWMLKKIAIKLSVSFDKIFWIEILKETVPFLGLAIVSTFYGNNDTLLIGRFFGSTQTGYYQSVYKIMFAFQSINFINNALFPRINVLIHENKKETLNKLVNLIVVFSLLGLVPLGIGITIFQKEIVQIIYGTEYLIAAPAMALLVWSGIFNYFRVLTSNLLFARSRQHDVFVAVLMGLIINLLINFLIMPRYNFTVAAWSMVVSEVVILGVTVWRLKTF